MGQGMAGTQAGLLSGKENCMAIKRKIVVDGFEYPSAAQAWRAEAVAGLNYTTFMERLYAGWEAWRALRVKPQSPKEGVVDEVLAED